MLRNSLLVIVGGVSCVLGAVFCFAGAPCRESGAIQLGVDAASQVRGAGPQESCQPRLVFFECSSILDEAGQCFNNQCGRPNPRTGRGLCRPVPGNNRCSSCSGIPLLGLVFRCAPFGFFCNEVASGPEIACGDFQIAGICVPSECDEPGRCVPECRLILKTPIPCVTTVHDSCE